MYTCPVCGYKRLDQDPKQRLYNICPCCGTEFGSDDFDRSHAELRNIWIAHGARWWSIWRKDDRTEEEKNYQYAD